MDIMLLWICLACGALSGLLAGMLGIGGGLITVPALYVLLPYTGVDATLLPQAAVATSLAAMVPTALSALWAQHRRGAVDYGWLTRLAPMVVAGAVAGSLLATRVHPALVSAVFAAHAGLCATRMLRRPTPGNESALCLLPTPAAGLLIGGLSVLAGVGGAMLTVPYLSGQRVPMARAVATSSGVGLVIAVASGAAFLLGGRLGGPQFVQGPAALALGLAACALAPLGVRLAHHLPVATLRRSFGLLMLAATASALWKMPL